jgi:hypothetical protein
MGYFDNLDDGPLNKYKKKILKMKKVCRCVLLDWWSLKFYVISLSFDSPSNFHTIYNGSNLTVFDGLSNDNEIVWNFNDHQSKNRSIYINLVFFLYLFRDSLLRLSK